MGDLGKLLQNFIYRDFTFLIGGGIFTATLYYSYCGEVTTLSCYLRSGAEYIILFFIISYILGLMINEILTYVEDLIPFISFRIKNDDATLIKGEVINKMSNEIPLFEMERTIYLKQIGFVIGNCLFSSVIVYFTGSIINGYLIDWRIILAMSIPMICFFIIGIYKRNEQERKLEAFRGWLKKNNSNSY